MLVSGVNEQGEAFSGNREHCAPAQFDGFQAAREGLRNGHAPKLAASGTGGSYFISGADGRPVAVFKPLDEEPLAANNPKQHKVGTSLSVPAPLPMHRHASAWQCLQSRGHCASVRLANSLSCRAQIASCSTCAEVEASQRTFRISRVCSICVPHLAESACT